MTAVVAPSPAIANAATGITSALRKTGSLVGRPLRGRYCATVDGAVIAGGGPAQRQDPRRDCDNGIPHWGLGLTVRKATLVRRTGVIRVTQVVRISTGDGDIARAHVLGRPYRRSMTNAIEAQGLVKIYPARRGSSECARSTEVDLRSARGDDSGPAGP